MLSSSIGLFAYGTSVCDFFAYMTVFVFVWVYVAHLLPVCDASDTAITLSPRPLPAAETVPEGGSRQLEGEDERYTLQSWSNDTASQHTLSLHFSLCLNYQQCRWEDMQ